MMRRTDRVKSSRPDGCGRFRPCRPALARCIPDMPSGVIADGPGMKDRPAGHTNSVGGLTNGVGD